MRIIFRSVATMVLVNAGWAGPAAAQSLCPALERIVAASQETPAFASLARVQETEVLVPGYYEGACDVRPDGVFCYRNIAPAELELPAMGAAIRACLDVRPVASAGGRPLHEVLTFSGHGLRFEVRNACSRICRAGLLAGFDITLERPTRRD